ncbi:glycosyltransferase [Geodermatophilus amargosae]|uniref:glycosyltransferase n=1 Tax=Geodermatophilus amargosae TaxID=1296565 RepID=UPI0034DF38C3
MTSPLSRLWPEAGLQSSDPLLLVASTGGHLTELRAWVDRLRLSGSNTWVTFDTPQSRALLDGADIEFLPYVGPRDLEGAIRARSRLGAVLRDRPWLTGVVSTGAGIAVPAFVAARRVRVARLYIESIARVTRPSLTGRLVQWSGLADLRAPYPEAARRPWRYEGGLLDQFIVGRRPPSPRPRLLVTVGTIRPYRFDALIDSVLETGLADERTTWQLGSTTRRGLPGQVVEELAPAELMEHARASDVVVTHAGAGTVLDLLRIGISPVVVPRRRARGEHVDDHQAELAQLLERRGLAHVREADELDSQTMREASGTMITSTDGMSPWSS